MKGKKGTTSDYRVPLCAESLAIIELARPFSRGEYVFSNTKGGPMIHSAPTKVMKSHGLTARVHGFRSSMRDWLAECTDCPEATTEAMLSHVTGSKVAAEQTTWRGAGFTCSAGPISSQEHQHKS